jgi:hypothetical protein
MSAEPAPTTQHCRYCKSEVVELAGKAMMKGRIPTHKHLRSNVRCPKANGPLYPEDVQ